MLTAQPPVCLLPSHPVTATSLMTALILSPNRDARPPPSSLSWTDCTGRGTARFSHSTVGHIFESALFSMWWLTLAWIDVASRQKVCCGIVYKGRFGEVIIDPRLFKPCCSSKKQKTLASTQVGTHLPNTLPPQLPEDVKPNWWLLFLNPPVGLTMARAWFCLQWQTSPFSILKLNLLARCFFLYGYFFNFYVYSQRLFYRKEIFLRALALFIGWGKNVLRFCFWFWWFFS